MAGPTKPPGKGTGKPFLGDDDLASELDAWDATFDALHVDEAAGAPAQEPVMAWPAAQATVVTPPPPNAADFGADPSATLDQPVFEDASIDDQLTLDRGHDDSDALIDVEVEVPLAGQRTPVEIDTFDSDPAETDFSAVGAQGQPAALGEMLGRHGTVPPIDDLDEPPTRIDVKSGPIRAASVSDEDDSDDGVFTSASRPAAAAPDDGGTVDPIAPPPAPEPRRGPAIVRRTPLQGHPVAPPPREEHKTPSHGVDTSAFGESTRIQSLDEIEAQAAATRQQRHQSKTAPPPIVQHDDDEYEVEIDASAAPEPVPDTAASRRTAHVVRRADTPTRPPPMGPGGIPIIPAGLAPDDGEGEVSMELDVDEPTGIPEPAGEDDFSDVAAAVATEDPLADLPPGPQPLTPRRASTPAIERQVGNRTIRPGLSGAINQPAPAARALDSALDGLDDEPPALEAPVPQVDDEATAFGAPVIDERPPAIGSAATGDFQPRVKTPTSVPPLGLPAHESAVQSLASETLPGMPAAGAAPVPRVPSQIPIEIEEPEPEPVLDVDAAVRAWPEAIEPLGPTALDEDAAQALLVYERELATIDDTAMSAALRIEAGRLSERLHDPDRARGHYDAALLADPRATAALRGLRRIARAAADLVEAVQHLEAEIAVAGALERRPLAHFRIDLLMASNEQDLARVAVGEVLDSAPSDVRALLAQLELAFLDGRADEFGSALEQLAHAVTDHELRAAVQSARGALAAHHNDVAGAASWFAAAAESDPTSLAARIGAVRQAAGQVDGPGAARALIDLAAQVASTDPLTASAAAVRAHQWQGGELGASAGAGGSAPSAPRGSAEPALAIAIAGAPQDPLVARLAAEASTSGDPAAAAAAYTHWSSAGASPIERAYAAARAAELDAGRGADLWSAALQLDPGDDYGAAQLRTAHVAAESTQASIDVDLAVATADPDRERARLRAAYGLIAQGGLEDAITVLQTGRKARPGSLALAEALGEALAAAGRWNDRAKLYAELAAEPGEQLDKDVAQLRSALAWEEAVGAAAAAEDGGSDELQRATAAALESWEKVLEQGAAAPAAHASAIVLAARLGDREVLAEVLARAQAAERSPFGATSLGLRRARLFAGDDASRTEAILRELADLTGASGLEDPRITVSMLIGAARRKEIDDCAAALEERARLIEGKATPVYLATLRLRAAQLFLDAGDAARATALLHKVEQALPTLGVVPDLLAAARRRAGDRPTKAPPRGELPAASSPDAFARIVRDADLAALHGDAAGALGLYQRALEMRPGDPLASVPLARVATQLRDPEPVSGLALAQLRAAEEANDAAAKASAYELLAHIDSELRSDPESAQISLASAAEADPTRIDLVHRLERHFASADQIAELIRLRRAQIGVVAPEHVQDRTALMLDLAGLATRDQRPEAELADLYRAVLQIDPKARLALMHLEMIVRRPGFSEELAELEEKIAEYFDGDPKSQAAFWTRAGETLGEIGKIDEAVTKFGRAEAGLPGHVPALEGWRQAALRGQLWIDVAEAANRQAANAQDDRQKAALFHMAGVALMDKALVGEQAMVAFRKALAADPKHRDSFLRLRILLEEDANHDDLATLLAQRLEVEDTGPARIELHRALAELHRNFLSDRETAKEHYRFILASEPNDLRAHAAVADIAWEQGNWQEAADALMSRARLEREPEILKTLCFRLGLIYADRLVDVPMAIKAFQRALTYQPDDEATLVRLAELATQAGEWKLALGACERLVKNETDPDRRASHLHRVAKIFKEGFGDTKRAERALNLALDGAPTNDDALSQLVQFYKDAGDMTSVRVHLNRVAGAMRARVAADPKDGVAYRVISRAMTARANAGVEGSRPIARAAAELADLAGASGEPEQKLLQTSAQPDLAALTKPEADEVLFPRGVQLELRQIFQLLGDRIAKHVGVDLRPYGATRGDRLRAKDNATASVVQSIATGLGFGEVDVYISQRQPWAMAAEPTSPVSVIIGANVAAAGGDAIRFAAGAALKLAQASLAIPARLAPEDLGVLVVGLLRLFQTDFPAPVALDADAIASQTQKLRRLIPTGLLNELKPYALAIDPQRFDHRGLARDLKVAGLRAGLVASGSILAGLRVLAAQADTDVPGFLADPVAQGLISFALGEDHAVVAR